MTKTKTFRGEPLTTPAVERIAHETRAELDVMSDKEIATRTRPPGTLAKRIGRPPIGDGPSEQIRVRLPAGRLAELDSLASSQHRTRSDVVRSAIEDYLAREAPSAGRTRKATGTKRAGRDRKAS